jgi:hypothetical protein
MTLFTRQARTSPAIELHPPRALDMARLNVILTGFLESCPQAHTELDTYAAAYHYSGRLILLELRQHTAFLTRALDENERTHP